MEREFGELAERPGNLHARRTLCRSKAKALKYVRSSASKKCIFYT